MVLIIGPVPGFVNQPDIQFVAVSGRVAYAEVSPGGGALKMIFGSFTAAQPQFIRIDARGCVPDKGNRGTIWQD